MSDAGSRGRASKPHDSTRNYKAADARASFPTFADDRVQIAAAAQWLDAPQVAFYSVGAGSPRERVNFGYRPPAPG